MLIHVPFRDLAPNIVRRRLVIEGTTSELLPVDQITTYMIGLSEVMNMTIVSQPTTNYDEDYGFSAYLCWRESGMHVYSWKETDNRPNFFSIDIYTCKDFNITDVINFTTKSFENLLTEVTWRE